MKLQEALNKIFFKYKQKIGKKRGLDDEGEEYREFEKEFEITREEFREKYGFKGIGGSLSHDTFVLFGEEPKDLDRIQEAITSEEPELGELFGKILDDLKIKYAEYARSMKK